LLGYFTIFIFFHFIVVLVNLDFFDYVFWLLLSPPSASVLSIYGCGTGGSVAVATSFRTVASVAAATAAAVDGPAL
jgi:hypothetical protein